MSDRPTPETDAIECKVVFWQMTEHAKKLERQRDAAVEALKIMRQEFEKFPRSLGYDITHLPKIDAVLCAIEGES